MYNLLPSKKKLKKEKRPPCSLSKLYDLSFGVAGSHKMPSLQTPSDDGSVSSDFSGDIGVHRDLNSSSEAHLERGDLFLNLHLGDKGERDCRICHLGLEGNSQELRPPIELGCSCKGDLGYAHKQCAETWFKIKGNMICEICGSTVANVAGEQTDQTNSVATASSTSTVPMISVGSQTLWHGRRIMNVTLGCMVFAFVISWLFHFKVLS